MKLLACVAAALLGCASLEACTAFCATGQGRVLVGNNEDDDNPFTVMWFIPGKDGKFGRMYVGYDDFEIQGGMNERGLWFDAFATAPVDHIDSEAKPVHPGNLADRAMSECSTVNEVLDLYSRYNLSFLRRAVLMFADANGDAVIIEPNAAIRKRGGWQVQTNFHQSYPKPEYRCERFGTATAMLAKAGEAITPDLVRDILAATHAEGRYVTIYSNVYDLRHRTMQLYHMHDFSQPVVIDLMKELQKGVHAVTMRSLLRPAPPSEAYIRRRAQEMNRVEPTEVKVNPALFDRFVGGYRLDNGIRFSVLREGKRLMLEADPLGRVPLHAASSNTFFLRITNAQITFLDDGTLIGRINGKETRGRRISDDRGQKQNPVRPSLP